MRALSILRAIRTDNPDWSSRLTLTTNSVAAPLTQHKAGPVWMPVTATCFAVWDALSELSSHASVCASRISSLRCGDADAGDDHVVNRTIHCTSCNCCYLINYSL